jgi:hypothetical protein
VKSVDAAMQDVIDDAAFDAVSDRHLELPLWFVGIAFVAAVIMTILLQGPLWLIALLSAILGCVLGEIARCRRRRRRVLARAARFKKLLFVDLLAKVRSMCAEFSREDLRTAIDVHRTGCHQPSCPVLAAMEDHARTREVSP